MQAIIASKMAASKAGTAGMPMPKSKVSADIATIAPIINTSPWAKLIMPKMPYTMV